MTNDNPVSVVLCSRPLLQLVVGIMGFYVGLYFVGKGVMWAFSSPKKAAPVPETTGSAAPGESPSWTKPKPHGTSLSVHMRSFDCNATRVDLQ